MQMPETTAALKFLDEKFAQIDPTCERTQGGVETLAHDGMVAAQQVCYELAAHSGWWIDPDTGEDVRKWPEKFLRLWVMSKLMLAVGEISEGVEAYRKGCRKDDHLTWMDGLTVEIADAIIRLLDLAGGLGLQVADAMSQKLAYNQQRADHTLAHRKGDGGKSI